MDPPALARRQAHRGRDHVGLVAAVLVERDQHRLVLGLGLGRRSRDRDLDGAGQVKSLPTAVQDVDEHAGGQPSHPGGGDGHVQGGDGHEREPGADPAQHREQRQLASGDRERAGTSVGPLSVGVLDPQSDHREVGDRERQHRAERIHVAQERRLPRDQRDARDPPEHDDPDPRRAEVRVQLAQLVRHLAVQAHRIDQPRDTDDPSVGRDEQDRRGQQADIDLPCVLQRPQVEVLDDPQHRVARVTTLALAEAQQRLAFAGGVAGDRQRRQRDRGQQRVDREHGQHHALDRRRDRVTLVLGLLGHVRDRLYARIGDHRHRDRDDEVLPRRDDAQLHVVDQRVW